MQNSSFPWRPFWLILGSFALYHTLVHASLVLLMNHMECSLTSMNYVQDILKAFGWGVCVLCCTYKRPWPLKIHVWLLALLFSQLPYILLWWITTGLFYSLKLISHDPLWGSKGPDFLSTQNIIGGLIAGLVVGGMFALDRFFRWLHRLS